MATGECVIVTGAGGNLGTAVAEVLAARGTRLVLVDRTPEALELTAARLPSGCPVLKIPGIDLADPVAVEEMVGEAEAFGPVVGLANTVGGFVAGRVADAALGQWDFMMTVNAKIALVLSAAVIPAMLRAGRGRIVHVSAQPGLKAAAGQASYAGSKAALIRIVESIAAEHRKDRITANCVLPSTIDTKQNRVAMPGAKTDTWVKPEQIARLIAWLLTEEAGVVTGAAIPATGPA
jgi:NAD(P)-dependent dehydrogenase (short-subunit alcohol dehydrogenase family)